MAKIINGTLLAEQIYRFIESKIAKILTQTTKRPKLATVLIGDNPASRIYVNAKIKAARRVMINTELVMLDKEITNDRLHEVINVLNRRADITGFLIQLPIPRHLDESIVFKFINYEKDVDGFGIYNTGLLNHWQSKIVPCTPQGILYILKKYVDDLSGKKAIVIGRSIIVGRPMATILTKENCTTVIAHSKTQNIESECRSADIIISAVGSPRLIGANWIKKNAFVVDVGINRVNSKIVGDVNFEEVKNIASYITPVPGGVGPLTVAHLMLNTLKLFGIQNNIYISDTIDQ